jgi:hypothetical protein
MAAIRVKLSYDQAPFSLTVLLRPFFVPSLRVASETRHAACSKATTALLPDNVHATTRLSLAQVPVALFLSHARTRLQTHLTGLCT